MDEREQKFIEFWNQQPGVCQVRKFTDKRKRLFRARMKDPEWPGLAVTALRKFPLQCFGEGLGSSGWRPNVEWFLRPDTVVQILEGKYDWSKQVPGVDTERARRAEARERERTS